MAEEIGELRGVQRGREAERQRSTGVSRKTNGEDGSRMTNGKDQTERQTVRMEAEARPRPGGVVRTRNSAYSSLLYRARAWEVCGEHFCKDFVECGRRKRESHDGRV